MRRAIERVGHRRSRRCAGASSGGCRARPSDCRWCPTCSRARRPGARRSRARRSASLAASSEVFVAEQAFGILVVAGMREPVEVMATKVLIVLTRSTIASTKRQEGHVEEERLVFGVVGDVDDLVGMQARIERVQHGARARHRVVELDVAIAVPGQRRDALAAFRMPIRSEGVGHLASSARRARGSSGGGCRLRPAATPLPVRRDAARHAPAARKSAAAPASSNRSSRLRGFRSFSSRARRSALRRERLEVAAIGAQPARGEGVLRGLGASAQRHRQRGLDRVALGAGEDRLAVAF